MGGRDNARVACNHVLAHAHRCITGKRPLARYQSRSAAGQSEKSHAGHGRRENRRRPVLAAISASRSPIFQALASREAADLVGDFDGYALDRLDGDFGALRWRSPHRRGTQRMVARRQLPCSRKDRGATTTAAGLHRKFAQADCAPASEDRPDAMFRSETIE